MEDEIRRLEAELAKACPEVRGIKGHHEAKIASEAKRIFDQQNQTIGSQTNIGGSATGPIFSGNFYGPLSINSSGERDSQQGQTTAAPETASGESSTGRISFSKKSELVECLLAIPTMADRDRRGTVLNELQGEIRTNIAHSSVDRSHIFNIVNACLRYDGGLDELRDILQYFEGRSIPMQQFEDTLRHLLPSG